MLWAQGRPEGQCLVGFAETLSCSLEHCRLWACLQRTSMLRSAACTAAASCRPATQGLRRQARQAHLLPGQLLHPALHSPEGHRHCCLQDRCWALQIALQLSASARGVCHHLASSFSPWLGCSQPQQGQPACFEPGGTSGTPLASWPACHVSLQHDQGLGHLGYPEVQGGTNVLQIVTGMGLCQAAMTGSPAMSACVAACRQRARRRHSTTMQGDRLS